MGGVEFHSKNGIVQILKEKYPEITGVHRLDKFTSGLMIFTRSEASTRYFSELFSSKKIVKYYLAITSLKPKKKQGIITGDLEKTRNGSYRLTRTMLNPSQTRFYSFLLEDISKISKLRGFILRPFTGKTHQLRVVLKSLGTPILGDERYKGDKADRLYLHAFRLEFTYQGKNFFFEDYPISGEYFLRSKERFREEFNHHFEASF